MKTIKELDNNLYDAWYKNELNNAQGNIDIIKLRIFLSQSLNSLLDEVEKIIPEESKTGDEDNGNKYDDYYDTGFNQYRQQVLKLINNLRQ